MRILQANTIESSHIFDSYALLQNFEKNSSLLVNVIWNSRAKLLSTLNIDLAVRQRTRIEINGNSYMKLLSFIYAILKPENPSKKFITSLKFEYNCQNNGL